MTAELPLLGFGLPLSGSWATPVAMRRIARRAEELGYASLWTFQRLLSPADAELGPSYRVVHDPVVPLAYVAGQTDRIGLGTATLCASMAGIGGSPLLGSYCATKAALIQLTRVATVEMRPSGVRVNAVCPGFADTKMVERVVPDFEAATQIPFADLVAMKQGRLGTPQDIAEVTAFLASDRASWITGSHYVLDGGLSASLV